MLENCTPMVAQYLNIKSQHKDEILFFRLGDFYEMFFEDATIASKELEITLTARDGGNKNKIPMCGVPYHAANSYIAKLIAKGFKVAICEQVEDPSVAKGIVQREVIRVVTAGSFLQDEGDSGSNRYTLHVCVDKQEAALAVTDIFTGEFKYQYFVGKDWQQRLNDAVFKLDPAEILISQSRESIADLLNFIDSNLSSVTISEYTINNVIESDKVNFTEELGDNTLVFKSIEGLVQYLKHIVKLDLSHLNKPIEIVQDSFMRLDATALKNLEILRNTADLTTKGSLYSILNYTNTNMGARKLRSSLEFPLLSINDITLRHQAVSILLDNTNTREDLNDILKKCCDIERIISKVELNTLSPRDALSLASTLLSLPNFKNALLSLQESILIKKIHSEFDLQTELTDLLHSALSEDAPISVKDGGVFKQGFNANLDELRNISQDSNIWLANFEKKLREQTGIKNLKIGYNKVFGYYIEVSKGNIAAVPDYFIRKQTLVNAERYIVEELKNFEDSILGAKERVYQMELSLFEDIKKAIQLQTKALQNIAAQIALLDMLLSFAVVAIKNNYVRPQIITGNKLQIVEGRHPVVEKLLKKEIFIANNTDFDSANMHIITGPNMAGKSTYMRQVALICIMAQIGSFIPAQSAVISPIKQVFTRVGASDDLATGQSTFMVEMQEVANILAQADAKSLIILDEVGRGTSTYDGISIARAVVEHIVTKIKAKTLFATHYHELIELENCLPDTKNYTVAIRERGKEIVFLRRIVVGASDKSYGVHVAQLAGLPKIVINRAQELVEIYSEDTGCCTNNHVTTSNVSQNEVIPIDMFTNTIIQELLDCDIPSMTPIEAMNTLNILQDKLKKLR